MEYKQLAAFVATITDNTLLTYYLCYHAAVGELLVCERESKNVVGTYNGSKDRSDTERKVVTHSP